MSLRAASIALSAAGVGVAGYLTLIHYTALETVCVGGAGGCERVQASDQALLLGLPVALLGLVAYIVLVVANAARGETARTTAAVVALSGAGFSLYLTEQSLVEIGATCQWCLLSTALMSALAVVTVARVLRPEPTLAPGALA